MRRMLGRHGLWVVALSACIALHPDESRALSAFAGALEPTQIANFVQLMEHTIHFIQLVKSGREQVRRWKQSLAQLQGGHLLKAAGMVRDIGGAISEYRTVVFGAKAELEAFRKKNPAYEAFQKDHPGYQSPGEAKKAYEKLDRETMDAVGRSLQAIDVQLNDPKGGIKAEEELVRELAGQIESADGTLKALQIADELLVVLTKQMEKLLIVMGAQATQQGAFIANETQRRSYGLYERDQILQRGKPPRTPAIDWSRDALKGF